MKFNPFLTLDKQNPQIPPIQCPRAHAQGDQVILTLQGVAEELLYLLHATHKECEVLVVLGHHESQQIGKVVQVCRKKRAA